MSSLDWGQSSSLLPWSQTHASVDMNAETAETLALPRGAGGLDLTIWQVWVVAVKFMAYETWVLSSARRSLQLLQLQTQ